MTGATTVLGTALGFAYGGIDWMCGGAVAGWLVDFALTAAFQRASRREAVVLAQGVVELRTVTEVGFENIVRRLPPSQSFYRGLLDAQPTGNYALTEFMEPRHKHEWEATDLAVWPIIRRRMVDMFGMSARQVDAAKSDIMTLRATTDAMPESDAELAAMRAKWRESEKEAWTLLDAAKGRFPPEGSAAATPS